MNKLAKEKVYKAIDKRMNKLAKEKVYKAIDRRTNQIALEGENFSHSGNPSKKTSSHDLKFLIS